MELNYYRRLRELREDHDYSQADIGKRLGMSKQQYFLYEKGYRDIPTPVLIADLYGTAWITWWDARTIHRPHSDEAPLKAYNRMVIIKIIIRLP